MPYDDEDTLIALPEPGMFDDLSDPVSMLPEPGMFDDVSDQAEMALPEPLASARRFMKQFPRTATTTEILSEIGRFATGIPAVPGPGSSALEATKDLSDLEQKLQPEGGKSGSVRQPFPGERDYYKAHPDVASMAGEDNGISINPFIEVSPADSSSLITNERVRIWMDKTNYEPRSNLTPEQEKRFKDYGTSEIGSGGVRDRRATVLARIIAGDSSAGTPTKEQFQEADQIKKLMGGPKESEGADIWFRNAARALMQAGIVTVELPRKLISPSWDEKLDAMHELSAMLPTAREDVRSSLGELLGPLYDAIAAPFQDEAAIERLKASGGMAPALSALMILAPFKSKFGPAKTPKPLLAERQAALVERQAGFKEGRIINRLNESRELAGKPPVSPDEIRYPEAEVPKVGKFGDLLNAIEGDVDQPGIGQFFATTSNYLGAIPGQAPRFKVGGQLAVDAFNRMVDAKVAIMVEKGWREEGLRARIARIAKEDYGKAGEKFWGSFEGRPIEEILADPDLKESTKVAAMEQRALLENDRVEIRDGMREKVRPAIERAVTAQYRRELGLKRGEPLGEEGGPARTELSRRIEAAVVEAVPDWGIDNYLPHLFPGDFLIKLKNESGWDTIASASTKFEAKAKLMELAADLGIEDPSMFKVETKEFSNPDMVRLSKGNYFRLKGEIEKALGVSGDEVREAMGGKIGMRQSRVKFAFFRQARGGATGYMKNFEEAMTTYNGAFVRHKYLTKMNAEVAPMIEQIRKVGNPGLADYMQNVLDVAWGKKQSASSRAVDMSLKASPFGKFVKPYALDRWLSTLVKWPVGMFKWKLSPKGNVQNLTQPYHQGLAAFSTGDIVRGEAFYRSAEGKKVLHENGVRFFSAGKLMEAGPSITGTNLRERMGALAPETRNQEMIWATGYKKATDMGMSPDAASKYAFLRGNLYTQFVHLDIDVPPIMRGPITSTMFMFQRFKVKDIELMLDIIKHKDFPAAGRYLGAKLLVGGAKAFTHPVSLIAGGGYLTMSAYRAVEKEHGKGVADFLTYGLPGLIGLDLSYSNQLADIPMGEGTAEKVGNVLLGAPGSSLLQLGTAMADTKGDEPSAFNRLLEGVKQTNPGVGRQIDLLVKLHQGADEEGLYDFRTPSGKLRYRGDLKDLIVYGMGGKIVSGKVVVDGAIVDDEPLDLWLDSYTDIQAKRSLTMDRIVSNAIKNPDYDMWPAKEKWDLMWPEFPIAWRDIIERRKAREASSSLTQKERALKSMPKAMRSYYETPDEDEDEE